ncbi:MAG TPA: GGDEF domain-containing protein [bacterium]|nr:GGDEF domain-containing protein [bacterium]
MAITTPIPYDVLRNTGLTGWTSNLSQFGLTAITWDSAPLIQRIRALDDTVGLLKNDPERHGDLIPRTEQALTDLLMGSPAPLDRRLLGEIARTLYVMMGEGANTVKANPSEELHRIISQPLDRDSGILVRGPAFLLRPREGRTEAMERFGPTVVTVWGPDAARAAAAFREVAFPRSPGDQPDLQAFAWSPEELERKSQAFIKQGFDVRSAPVPAELMPNFLDHLDPDGLMKIGGRPVVHWIVAQKNATPLGAWFRRFVDERDALKGPYPIQTLTVLGREMSPDDPDLEPTLSALFGRPVSWQDFRKGFAIDVPRYVTRNVTITRDGDRGVKIVADIATGGETATSLSGRLQPPPANGPWIANGDDLNQELLAGLNPEKVLKHLNQGIGRRALTHVLVFLHRLGVNALDMKASGQGLAFMPMIGFDFPDENTRRRILQDFADYLADHDAGPSDKVQRALMSLRHAWDIVEFQNDRGEPVGRDFLAYYTRSRKGGIPLRFRLDNGYAGWWRLFSPDLALHQDLDPRAKPEGDGEDRVEKAMALRISKVTEGRRAIDLSVPPDIRRRLAELEEAVLYQQEKLKVAQTNADYDDLTKLLKRRAFLANNQELEQSLSANRKGDNPQGHWAMMIDIDHFKNVNDTYGHVAGDEVIRRVAQVLRDTVRNGDLVCRWGGEEFALILRNSGESGMKRVADLILQSIRSIRFEPRKGVRLPISVTIGASAFRIVPTRKKTSGEFNPWQEPTEDVTNSMTESLRAADELLYKGKDNGRDQVVYEGMERASAG